MYWLEQYFLIDGKSTIVILYYFNEALRLEIKSYRDEAESNHILFVMLLLLWGNLVFRYLLLLR